MMYKIRRRAIGAFMDNAGLTMPQHHTWETTFFNKWLRVTPREVLTILCSKLSWPSTRVNRRRLADDLKWSQFYGTLSTHGSGLLRRNFVGLGDNSTRCDFIRIRGPPENNTCLTVQLLAFVGIVGFNDQLVLPRELRNPPTNSVNVTLV